MRLTLRTMLAYLDDILEPEDAEDIGKKIEESEFAQSLVHRTRDCMRRLRLGAPPIQGRGLGVDANTVAEYLDNTLPAERVPELERICLESDSHLAEAAACHQILTLVLGEPADVDPQSRERMYHLIARVDAPPVVPPVVTEPVGVAPAGQAEPVTKRSRPEVPEYLRERRSRFWPTAAALAVAAAILIVAMVLGAAVVGLAPPQFDALVARLWHGKQPPAADENLPTVDMGPPAPGPDDMAEDQGSGDADAAAVDASASRVSSIDGEHSEVDVSQTGKHGPTNDEPPLPEDDMPSDETAPLPLAGAPNVAVADGPEPMDDGSVPPAAGSPEGPDAAAPAEVAGGLGRYLYKQDVLLRYDRGQSTWRRLAPRATLVAGDRLLALPLFRPTVALSSGVMMEPVDASLVELQGLDAAGVPEIAVDFGRLILATAGKPRNQVRLRLGDRQGLITFADGESAVALEVRRLRVPGKDPETGVGPLAIDLYAVSGGIVWEEAGKEVVLDTLGRVTLAPEQEPPVAGGELPKWTRAETLNQLEQRGALALEHELNGAQPIGLTLKELSDNRRVEVSSLAIRCSAYIDQFEPAVAALNDATQRLIWPVLATTLEDSLARGPETATKVRDAFEKRRGNEAAALYRMLWGYSADDLKNGGAAKLVDDLNSEALDVRVLAFQNLVEITGKNLGYHPEAPLIKRRPIAGKWKEKLREGSIVPSAKASLAPPAGRLPAGAPRPTPEPPVPSDG